MALIERTLQVRQDTPAAVRPHGHAMGPAGVATRTPVLLRLLEGYTIVSYEGWVYGLPQSLGAIDLTEVDVMEMSGVIRDVSQDVAGEACLAQCLAACGYCAPLPLSIALPVKADSQPAPRKYAVLRGAIAAPHPRPPSIS